MNETNRRHELDQMRTHWQHMLYHGREMLRHLRKVLRHALQVLAIAWDNNVQPHLQPAIDRTADRLQPVTDAFQERWPALLLGSLLGLGLVGLVGAAIVLIFYGSTDSVPGGVAALLLFAGCPGAITMALIGPLYLATHYDTGSASNGLFTHARLREMAIDLGVVFVLLAVVVFVLQHYILGPFF